jgi:hypothetical protein
VFVLGFSMKKSGASNRIGVKAYVQANRRINIKPNATTGFNGGSFEGTDDLAQPLVRNARKSGVLNLAGRNLTKSMLSEYYLKRLA